MKKGLALATAAAVTAIALVATLLVMMMSGGVSGIVGDDSECDTGTTQVADTAEDAPEADDGTQGVNTAARAALRAGWTGEDAVTAVAVAGAESGYNPEAANAVSTARGMWQIMLSYHQPKFDGDDWRDPYANARVAHIIWKDSGWSPWVAYTSGAYKSHVAEARTAIRTVAGRTVQAAFSGAVALPRVAPSYDDNTDGMQPVAKAAAQLVRSKFGFTGTIGGYSNRNIAGTNTKSKHASGLAIDVMTGDRSVGDPIADYFSGPGYAANDVENVIWQRRIYNAARGWHAYTGVSPHTDHVHVDFKGDSDLEPGDVAAAPAAAPEAADCADETEAAAGGGQGGIVYPLESGAKYDRKNYGGSGAHWASTHTGTDYSVPCGTTVRASTDGTIQFDTSALWAGKWLVKVSTGSGKLTTWYAHMQSVNVTPGEQVTAGQTIGRVGKEGNATGCHLHFEVHPKGGGIYEDGVNPTPWLAKNVGPAVLPALGPGVGAATGDSFILANFNALGNSHTTAGGKDPGKASGAVRTIGLVQLLRAHDVSVAGLQEFEGAQHDAFGRLAPDYGIWNPKRGGANPVVWRKADWDLVGTSQVMLPYFNGRMMPMPIAQLRQKGSGRVITVVNSHHPADTRKFRNQQRFRDAALVRELAAATRLAAGGAQVFVTGDKNDRERAFCGFTRTGVLHSASGGTNNGTCRPARRPWIDWIFGSRNVTFAGYSEDRSPLVKRTSDHPIIYTLVR